MLCTPNSVLPVDNARLIRLCGLRSSYLQVARANEAKRYGEARVGERLPVMLLYSDRYFQSGSRPELVYAKGRNTDSASPRPVRSTSCPCIPIYSSADPSQLTASQPRQVVNLQIGDSGRKLGEKKETLKAMWPPPPRLAEVRGRCAAVHGFQGRGQVTSKRFARGRTLRINIDGIR
jgi:hypothetical protein